MYFLYLLGILIFNAINIEAATYWYPINNIGNTNIFSSPSFNMDIKKKTPYSIMVLRPDDTNTLKLSITIEQNESIIYKNIINASSTEKVYTNITDVYYNDKKKEKIDRGLIDLQYKGKNYGISVFTLTKLYPISINRTSYGYTGAKSVVSNNKLYIYPQSTYAKNRYNCNKLYRRCKYIVPQHQSYARHIFSINGDIVTSSKKKLYIHIEFLMLDGDKNTLDNVLFSMIKMDVIKKVSTKKVLKLAPIFIAGLLGLNYIANPYTH